MPPKHLSASSSPFRSSAASPEPTPSRNLFVAGFKDALDDNALLHLFRAFGPIESAKVMQDVHTGASRGFGFILFADVIHATVAVNFFRTCRYVDAQLLTAAPVPSESSAGWIELKVNYAMHDAYNVVTANTKVYCRNIPLSMTADQLKAVLEGLIGPHTVTSIALQGDSQRSPAVFVRHNDPTSQVLQGPRGNVAFVELASPVHAQLAVSATAKLRLDGVGSLGPLMTKLAETQKVRSERRKRGHPSSDPSVQPPPMHHMDSRPGPQPPSLVTMSLSTASMPHNPPSLLANPTLTSAAPPLHGGPWVLAPGFSMAPPVTTQFVTLGTPAGIQTYASPNPWPAPTHLQMPASFFVGPPLPHSAPTSPPP